MARFLCPELTREVTSGQHLRLSKDQTHHLTHVLRIPEGATIEIFNGQGIAASAKITKLSGGAAEAQILEIRQAEDRSKICLAFAVPKGTALDLIVHKATEIGVGKFQPLVTEHSLPAKNWNADRWQRVIAETAKQCQEDFLPTMESPRKLGEWLASRPPTSGLVFCHENLRKSGETPLNQASSVDLLIGSEGGWSTAESQAILALNPMVLGLGKNRLRAETAALVALTRLKLMVGELV